VSPPAARTAPALGHRRRAIVSSNPRTQALGRVSELCEGTASRSTQTIAASLTPAPRTTAVAPASERPVARDESGPCLGTGRAPDWPPRASVSVCRIRRRTSEPEHLASMTTAMSGTRWASSRPAYARPSLWSSSSCTTSGNSPSFGDADPPASSRRLNSVSSPSRSARAAARAHACPVGEARFSRTNRCRQETPVPRPPR
jgi:hypothetical protein